MAIAIIWKWDAPEGDGNVHRPARILRNSRFGNEIPWKGTETGFNWETETLQSASAIALYATLLCLCLERVLELEKRIITRTFGVLYVRKNKTWLRLRRKRCMLNRNIDYEYVARRESENDIFWQQDKKYLYYDRDNENHVIPTIVLCAIALFTSPPSLGFINGIMIIIGERYLSYRNNKKLDENPYIIAEREKRKRVIENAKKLKFDIKY